MGWQSGDKQRGHHGTQAKGNGPQAGDVFARDDIDHLAHQVIGAGVGVFKDGCAADTVQPCGFTQGLTALGKGDIALGFMGVKRQDQGDAADHGGQDLA